MDKATINVEKEFFQKQERSLISYGNLKANLFLYPSGVQAIRLVNTRGQIIVLPYQGQQVWSAAFDGQEMTMRSMFSEPRQTKDYLKNYGGFLLHCGVSAMGVPGEKDTHPLHGELPNAPYDSSFVIFGEDQEGRYLGVGGEYQYTVAFAQNYLASPLVKLYEDKTVIKVQMTIKNLKKSPMELMYMAHINFRPVDGSSLAYSAHKTPEAVRVRTSIPGHIHPPAGYKEFLAQLAKNPEHHHLLEPELAFDPEVVFSINYQADAEGWAHSLQIHPDGSSDYVAHQPLVLDKGVRWISRTEDQDALGLVLPATAEPEGYSAEKAKGNIKVLGPGETFQCQIRIGRLTDFETIAVGKQIERIINK